MSFTSHGSILLSAGISPSLHPTAFKPTFNIGSQRLYQLLRLATLRLTYISYANSWKVKQHRLILVPRRFLPFAQGTYFDTIGHLRSMPYSPTMNPYNTTGFVTYCTNGTRRTTSRRSSTALPSIDARWKSTFSAACNGTETRIPSVHSHAYHATCVYSICTPTNRWFGIRLSPSV